MGRTPGGDINHSNQPPIDGTGPVGLATALVYGMKRVRFRGFLKYALLTGMGISRGAFTSICWEY